MLKKGRPQLYSITEKRFYDLYLNPLMSPAEICKICKISKSTYYNYEFALNRPQFRVAIGNSHSHLPFKKALKLFQTDDEKAELSILQNISRILQARIHLVPTSMEHATHQVRSQNVDFAMASLSWTQERAKDLYFSNTYLPGETPFGVLMKIKGQTTTSLRPRLGVCRGGIHSEYAHSNLQNEFKVLTYQNPKLCFQALNKGKIDFVLFHPLWLDVFPEFIGHIEVCSAPYSYKSFTSLLFHRNSEHLRPVINQALEILFDKT